MHTVSTYEKRMTRSSVFLLGYRIATSSRSFGEGFTNTKTSGILPLFLRSHTAESKLSLHDCIKKSRTIVLLVLVLVAGEGFEPPTSGL